MVFWVDPADNTHGLVCAIQDQSPSIQWYNGSTITTGATGTAIGTGASNTNAIILAQGPTSTNYAAGLARSYTGGGFNDWFLPSKDELYEMYLNRVAINDTATAKGGSAFDLINIYWSSTESNFYEASYIIFKDDLQSSDYAKNFKSHARAIRAF